CRANDTLRHLNIGMGTETEMVFNHIVFASFQIDGQWYLKIQPFSRGQRGFFGRLVFHALLLRNHAILRPLLEPGGGARWIRRIETPGRDIVRDFRSLVGRKVTFKETKTLSIREMMQELNERGMAAEIFRGYLLEYLNLNHRALDIERDFSHRLGREIFISSTVTR
ncbi:unnamed protein product, partial [Discosporangium mesarthrocarpum]